MDTNEPRAERPLEAQQTAPVAVKQKTKSRPAVVVLSVLLLLTLFGAGALGYAMYNQTQTLDASNEEIKRLLAEKASLKNATSVEPGGDLFVESHLCGQAYKSVEAYMSTSGVERMETNCRIEYLDDDFARVAVDYMVPDPTNGKNKPSGKGEVFYFKRTEPKQGEPKPSAVEEAELWAMIAINSTDADEIQTVKSRYGVPDKVFTEDQPA